MPTRTLTAKYLAGLRPPASGRLEVRDALVRGLELRLTDKGAATWRLLYRRHGRLERLTLGPYPALSLAAAREQARARLAEAASGRDPAAAKRERREAETIETLVERFLETYLHPLVEAGKRSPAYARETARLLRSEVVAVWRRRKAKEITRRDVKALLGDIVARPAPITANRTRSALSKFFNWLVDQDVLEVSPVLRLKRPAEEQARDRVLTDAEVRGLWKACDALDPFMAAHFRLRLLTAQRGGELLGMRWDQLDEAGEWWTIPGKRTKNRQAHRVPLSPQARAILGGLPQVGPYVCPGRHAEQPRRSIQDAWAVIVEAAELKDAVPHDLRRKAATGMASLGVPRFTIRRVLNHTEPGITSVYDRYSYDAEKKAALEKWGRHVEAILAGGKGPAEVVALEARRAEVGR